MSSGFNSPWVVGSTNDITIATENIFLYLRTDSSTQTNSLITHTHTTNYIMIYSICADYTDTCLSVSIDTELILTVIYS